MSTPTTRPEQTEYARLETARAIYFAWIILAATTGLPTTSRPPPTRTRNDSSNPDLPQC